MFKVFARNWYKPNASWPNGREPSGTERKTTLATVSTEAEAREICKEYNASHAPGKLSRKAEYTSL